MYYLHDLQVNGLGIYQMDTGFKFGTDAIALVNFAKPKRFDIMLDIGSGSGIIPIMMAGKFFVKSSYGVDIQKEFVDMSNASLLYNKLQNKVKFFCTPIQELNYYIANMNRDCYNREDNVSTIVDEIKNKITLVTSNPPYYKVGSGDCSVDNSMAISRFEKTLTLKDTVKAARTLLRTGGRFCIVHRVERLAEVINCCVNLNLEPKRLKFILPKLFLMECVVDAKVGLIVE